MKTRKKADLLDSERDVHPDHRIRAEVYHDKACSVGSRYSVLRGADRRWNGEDYLTATKRGY